MKLCPVSCKKINKFGRIIENYLQLIFLVFSFRGCLIRADSTHFFRHVCLGYIKYSNCIGGFVTAVVPNRVEEVGRNRYVEVNEVSTESEQKLRRCI